MFSSDKNRILYIILFVYLDVAIKSEVVGIDFTHGSYYVQKKNG